MECINNRQFELYSSMRLLWLQHVYWTRLLIISILDDLKDLEATQARLLKNPVDLGILFGEYYGEEVQKLITDLLTEHLVIGSQLITATKNNQTELINQLNAKWYTNADNIAKAMASINPYYLEEEVKEMMYMHLDLTKREVSLRLQGKFAEDIINFDNLEQEILAMADYFVDGIIRQFGTRYSSIYY